MCLGDLLQQRDGVLVFAPVHHFDHSGGSFAQVVERGDVVMAAAEALFVHSCVLEVLQAAPVQSALHGPFHEPLRTFPTDAQQCACLAGARRALQHGDAEGLEHPGEGRVLGGPWHPDGFDAATLALAAWHPSAQLGLKLHGVQMPPLPLRRVIEDAATTLASRTDDRRTARVPQPDMHRTRLHAQLHLLNLPVLVESEE